MADASVSVNTTSTLTGNNISAPGYLIIIAGQSNGTDRFTISGNLPAASIATQSKAYSYFKTTNTTADDGAWQLYHAGYNTTAAVVAGTDFGVSATMCERLQTVYGKYSYILQTAVGGTYIANDVTPSWYSTHSNEYYTRLVSDYFRKAYPRCSTGTLTPILIWVHGESDSDTAAHGNAYNTATTDLINKFRIDSGFPNMKVIITRLRSNYGGPSLGLTAVRTAQTDIANTLSNVVIYDTEVAGSPLSTDLQHYNPIVASYGGTQSALNIGIGLADLISTY